VKTGTCLHDIAWESGPVNLCAFVPPSCSMQAAGGQAPLLLTCHVQLQRHEGRVLAWDVLRREQGWVDGKIRAPVKAVDGFRGRVTSFDVAMTPDGCMVLAAACSDGLVRVLDISDAGE
jgi:hypothetical protein